MSNYSTQKFCSQKLPEATDKERPAGCLAATANRPQARYPSCAIHSLNKLHSLQQLHSLHKLSIPGGNLLHSGGNLYSISGGHGTDSISGAHGTVSVSGAHGTVSVSGAHGAVSVSGAHGTVSGAHGSVSGAQAHETVSISGLVLLPVQWCRGCFIAVR